MTATAHRSSRRDFAKTTIALGMLLGGMRARAETPSGLIVGFGLTPTAEELLGLLMDDLHAHYRTDIGSHPIYLAGNSGALAMTAVASARPDGTTALLTTSSSVTLLPLLTPLPTDPATALLPVAGIGDFAYRFIVGPAVPESVRSMPDYLRWARENPGRATYGLPSRGTSSHFIGTEIARLSDVGMKAVAYKGLLPILQDLTKGSLPAAVTPRPAGDDQLFPTLRTLAVSSGKRWPFTPETPTLLELGLAESPTLDAFGLFLPSGTPTEKVAEMNGVVRQWLQSASALASLRKVGLVALPADHDFALRIARERADWQKRIALHRFTAES